MLKFHLSLSLFLSLSLPLFVNQADGNHEADHNERAYCFLIDRAISYRVQKTSIINFMRLIKLRSHVSVLTTYAVLWPDVERPINADLFANNSPIL